MKSSNFTRTKVHSREW